jgi:hypothetical protein
MGAGVKKYYLENEVWAFMRLLEESRFLLHLLLIPFSPSRDTTERGHISVLYFN